MSEGKVESNGIHIYYEDFGDPGDSTVLFIMGGAAQCTRWPMELIDPIVDAGYHVVRFDSRDVGYSTWIDEEGAEPFTLEDMADDTVGLLDALEIKKVHVIGASMGGMLAQIMAINHPDRVLTLTTWMSSYDMNDPEVPAMTETFAAFQIKIMERLQHILQNFPQGRDKIIDVQVESWKMLSGSRFPFNEEEHRVLETREFDRAYNPKVYQALDLGASPSRLDALRRLDVPTLVMHGDEDPIIQYIHGVICAKVIPGAKLFTQKGLGHELPKGIIPEIVPVILEHIDSNA